ncbi:MAG TPA: dephospho-CoA kinase [Bacillota bacterium]|nr:dephospho-CoA kinase [Bacillota bacterium]
MKVLGLTGGVGMGKSACAQLLRNRGVPVIDTDDLARQVVEPGQPALNQIRQLFGPEVLNPEGGLQREALARRVFADPQARQHLEAILHPPIRQLWRAQMAVWSAAGHPLAAVVIPLLFETGAQHELDATLCVACSAATQQARLLGRGWLPEQIAQRIAAQWPIEKKTAQSTYVLWNEAGLDVLDEQLDRLLRRLGPPHSGPEPWRV